MVTPRVQVIQTSNGVAFVRSGKLYEHTIFGGGLRDAVSGVPKAEKHAMAHENLQVAGFVFGIGGAALATTASFVVSQPSETPQESVEQARVGLALVGGAAIASAVSLVLYMRSSPHVWDAINVYNDELQRAAIRKWRRSKGRHITDGAR